MPLDRVPAPSPDTVAPTAAPDHTETAASTPALGLLSASQYHNPANHQQRVLAAQRLQRQVGNQATTRLLRQPASLQRAEPSAEGEGEQQPAVTLSLEETTMTTCGEGALFILKITQSLKEALDEAPEAPVAGQINALLDEKAPLIDEGNLKASDPLDQGYADDLRAYHSRYHDLDQRLTTYKQQVTRERLEAKQQELELAKAEAVAGAARLAEYLRSFFPTGDYEAVTTLSATMGTYLDIGMALNEMARTCAETIAQLQGTKMPPASAGVGILNKANGVIAAINSLVTIKGLIEGGATENQTAVGAIGAAASLFGTSVTIAGAVTGATLFTGAGIIANFYLGPMVSEVLQRTLSILDAKARAAQIYGIAIGDPDVVLCENHVGGGAMYNFMLQVMHASSSAEVPWEDAPESVKETFGEQYEKFSAVGTSELPTTGYWLWREVDPSKIKAWVFRNRRNLWASLYGAWEVPPDADYRVKETCS